MKNRPKRRTRRVTLDKAGEPKPTRRETVPVIVMLHGDGWCEVFAPRHVWAVVVNRLDEDGPVNVAAELANLADEYHERELPKQHREYFWPVCLRAVGLCRRRTPEGDSRIAAELAFVRGCVSLAKERRAST